MAQMKISLTIIAILLLSGCITIPVPPYGEHAGKLGAVTITFGYKMASSNKKEKESGNEAQMFAYTQFSKALKDK